MTEKTPAVQTCANPISHGYIRVHRLATHHVFPQSWGGTDTAPNTVGTDAAPANTVDICATCHDNAHDLLNQYVHHQGMPGKDVLRLYDHFTRDLGSRAWKAWLDAHPGGGPIPPYTAAVLFSAGDFPHAH